MENILKSDGYEIVLKVINLRDDLLCKFKSIYYVNLTVFIISVW